jgi:hypothetical protein
MIIGISGYAKAGKDTIGRIIQYMHCKNVGDIGLEEMLKYYDNHEWWLEDQSGWEIKKYAGKLKQIASLLTGIPVESFEDQEVKNSYLNSDWDHDGKRMLVREFLQKLGTESIRDIIHPNAWVLALMSDYKALSTYQFGILDLGEPGGFEPKNSSVVYPNWIITDVRFPNEAKAIKDKGGIIIRVDRPGVKPINPHPSETALDNWEFDYKIANVSDFKALAFTVQTILEKT